MPLEDDIKHSGTLSAEYYNSPENWERTKVKIFGRSWSLAGRKSHLFEEGNNLNSFLLIEDYLEEPLLLVLKDDVVRCMSNVCTHRAFLLVNEPVRSQSITCKYHGRRFSLDGRFKSMPEFKEAENFPRPCDDLAQLPLKTWRDFLFTGLDPLADLSGIFKRLNERLDFLPLEHFRFAPELSTTYEVKSHWALYVENYLEGFHIPFVHATLNSMLDYSNYTTECYDHMVLQIGYADKESESFFDLPAGHPDFGKKVVGYYYWLFPNLMLNLYTWGLQINVVRPVSIDTCKVDFTYYIYDEQAWSEMDGERIAEITQIEDEWVVEGVQKGLRSQLYPGGRFSPKREKGVHHFQKLFRKYLDDK